MALTFTECCSRFLRGGTMSTGFCVG